MTAKGHLAISSLLLFAIYLFSCSPKHFSVTVPNDFQMLATRKENKIPLRAGLHLKMEYQKLIAPKLPYENQTVHMGGAFFSGCERMLRNIFQDVIVIDQEGKNRVDVIVTPEITKWEKGMRLTSENTFPIWMDIRWNILSPGGEMIYLNTVKSEVWPKISRALAGGETRRDELKTAYLVSLNDQLLRAQEDIYSSKWWANKL